MSVYHHYTHIVNAFCSVEGATTPTLKNAPSILSPLCSSLWPFGVFFWPFAGGSGPFDLGPAPLRLGTCATSWTEGVYWSPRRGLFPSSSGHKRGSLGFALPLLRGKDLFITKCVAGTIHSLDCFFPWRSTSSVYHESRIPVVWSLGQAISSLSLMSWSLSASGPICPAGRHCHGDYRAAASIALPRT